MSTTKADLVQAVLDHTGLTKLRAITLVEQLFEIIVQRLAKGETVKLTGFGVFSVRNKPARPGRNPKSGEPCEITARKVVTFRVSPLVMKDDGEQTSFGLGNES